MRKWQEFVIQTVGEAREHRAAVGPVVEAENGGAGKEGLGRGDQAVESGARRTAMTSKTF